MQLSGVQVRAEPREPGATDLVIEAERSTWDLAARTARFEDGVQARRGELTLTCDAAEVSYAADNTFRQAVAEGGVVAVRGRYRAGGERAVLDVAEGVLTLTGSPWLEDGVSALSGEQIIFALDDEQVDCLRCRLVVGAELLEGGGP